MARTVTCSRCGKTGHNARWCSDAPNRGARLGHQEPPLKKNPAQEARDAADQAAMAAGQANAAAERAAQAAREAASPEPRSMYLTPQQHVDALRRLRRFISPSETQGRFTGGELVAWDSDEIGAKDTECSWGQCTGRPEQWPADTRMWPERALLDGRVYGVKYHQDGQFCPFDRRAPEGSPMHNMSSGCFQRCRIFHPLKSEPRPSREEALQMFDATIQKYLDGDWKLARESGMCPPK